MLNNPRLTDERLCSWLDANQLDRERLCQAILTLDGRFQRVSTRQPRGGPDGGRDLQAVGTNGDVVFAAIGFRNQCSDSDEDRKWAEKKCLEDAARSLEASSSVRWFIFMSNVNLPVKRKQKLIEKTKQLGFGSVEYIDREYMRVALDAPDGLAFRYQYLAIPLSEAEQQAFFGRWGGRIEGLITDFDTKISNRIDRIQFMLEKTNVLRDLLVILELDDGAQLKPGDHFRASASLSLFSEEHKFRSLAASGCNHAAVRRSEFFHFPDQPGILHHFQSKRAVEDSEDLDTGSTGGAGIWERPLDRIVLRGEFSHWSVGMKPPNLEDLDSAMLAVVVNEQLVSVVRKIVVVGNEYLLSDLTRDQLSLDDPISEVVFPWPLDSTEAKQPWKRFMPNLDNAVLRFSEYTPKRRFDAWGEIS